MLLLHPREKRDYSDIRDDIIRRYQEMGSVYRVARHFMVSTATVSKICKEEGLLKNPGTGRKPLAYSIDSCIYCRHYSRTSLTEGYCLRHRHSVKAAGVEHCYAK